MLDANGDVYAFGNAVNYGSWPAGFGPVGGAVGLAPDATGDGYWLVDAFGDVANLGDVPQLGAPEEISGLIYGITATPSGGGYWLFGGDGSVYTFGNAVNDGGTQNLP